MDINIFTQVGFIVLVGLACKNAILIVEFAKAQREAGSTGASATLEACELRLRPIMMTSFAFILGVVPLMISAGAGAEMRQTLGTAVFSGMLGVTLFGIFLTPVFYYVIQWVSDRRGGPRRRRGRGSGRQGLPRRRRRAGATARASPRTQCRPTASRSRPTATVTDRVPPILRPSRILVISIALVTVGSLHASVARRRLSPLHAATRRATRARPPMTKNE